MSKDPCDTIPSVLQPGKIGSNPEQRIDTDILEPVIFTDSFIRYQLQNKGMLNPQSRLTFSLKNHGSINSFFPAGLGVGSIIERATLKIGGKTICEVQDWNHYQAFKSMFIDQSVIKEREQYNSARLMSNGVVYDPNTNVSNKVAIDIGKEFTQSSIGGEDMEVHTFQKLASDPVFSVTLDDLFPAIRGIQLPLFMISGDVNLELTLTPTLGKRACIASAGDNSTQTFDLDQTECRMIADYTFMDGDEMEAFRVANRDFSYMFLEPRLTKTTLATQADAQNVIRNVGGAGRLVSKLFVGVTSSKMSVHFSASGSGNQKSLLNDYRAIAPEMSAARTYGQLTSNIKKNDEFLYPLDRSNSALHFHGVADAEGTVPHITRAEYARQGNSISAATFEGYPMNGQQELTGQFFWNAYRLNSGDRVDSRGIELHHKYLNLAVAEAPYTSRCWIELQKVMRITDGQVDCYYS
tara:strand:+ start:8087 stop:9484 length:1398 start_codon:yes stop_codon:yes gene_type:complete